MSKHVLDPNDPASYWVKVNADHERAREHAERAAQLPARFQLKKALEVAYISLDPFYDENEESDGADSRHFVNVTSDDPVEQYLGLFSLAEYGRPWWGMSNVSAQHVDAYVRWLSSHDATEQIDDLRDSLLAAIKHPGRHGDVMIALRIYLMKSPFPEVQALGSKLIARFKLDEPTPLWAEGLDGLQGEQFAIQDLIALAEEGGPTRYLDTLWQVFRVHRTVDPTVYGTTDVARFADLIAGNNQSSADVIAQALVVSELPE